MPPSLIRFSILAMSPQKDLRENLPPQTKHAIHFLVVGGGVGGLACAIALRRVGHRVTVLEKNLTLEQTMGGSRVPPNLSKILYHWGLKDEMAKISTKSDAIHLLLARNPAETGETVGVHHWNEEMLKEVRGDFVSLYHADLRKLLYDVAIDFGVKVRFGACVVAVDPDEPSATLATQEVINADVIIGADGVRGVCRRLLTPRPAGRLGTLNMYSTTIRREDVLACEELRFLYETPETSMFTWWGNGRFVLIFPIGPNRDIGMCVYGPRDGIEDTWDKTVAADGMHAILAPCEPRLRKLAELSQSPVCVNVREYEDLEDWVHDSGRLIIIGEAAHPLPAGAIQLSTMAVEDAAALGRLFCHLKSDEQIPDFLWALQNLRRTRCSAVYRKEAGDLVFMSIPPGEAQEARDSVMRAKRDAGIDALASTNGFEESPEWEEIKEVFAYDAEDEADNWWQEWGILKERALGNDIGFHMEHIAVSTITTSLNPIAEPQAQAQEAS
ncbi:hypothetical protein AX16_005177 [Volvariella volvacea WC 439]|nr:hypothetical protein AX16_005177 [Volvariella volvacea WC 439]